MKAVRAAVSIPVAVKLSPYFSSVGNMVIKLQEAGADADLDAIRKRAGHLHGRLEKRLEIRRGARPWIGLVADVGGGDLHQAGDLRGRHAVRR